MNSQKSPKNALKDIEANARLMISAAWSSFMFLYIYVDYFHLYMPKSINDLISGRVFEFEINPSFLFIALVSVTIPALMIFLSIVLPAKISRWSNLGVATIYIPYTLFNLAGEAWLHMMFGAAVEVALLLAIIWNAWKWPEQEA